MQNLRFHLLTNSKILDVTSKDSKNFHVNLQKCEKVEINGFTISAPKESMNTDGIHIGRSTGINITDTTIGTGDDCISIGDGTKDLTVTNVACGPGHGIAIGSLGRYPEEEPVSGINIKKCTLTDTTNGVRIKTWPASPKDSTAKDIITLRILPWLMLVTLSSLTKSTAHGTNAKKGYLSLTIY